MRTTGMAAHFRDVKWIHTEGAVHEVLAGQPAGEMKCNALSALFAPKDEKERARLTLAVARVASLGEGTDGTSSLGRTRLPNR